MSAEPTGWVPDACTLSTEQQPLRVAEFESLWRSALRRVERREATWLRLYLSGAVGVLARTRDLATRETACCTFFDFDVQLVAGEVLVDVRVPDGRTSVLDVLQRQAVSAATPGSAR